MKNVSTACLVVVLAAAVCTADIRLQDRNKEKTYGNALVAKIIAVDNTYTFRCDIEGWPAIVGSDIPVKINGIFEPLIVAEEGKPNLFFQAQAKKFLASYLSESKTIDLKNIRRGQDFSLIADVVVDSNSLADILIENGLARRITRREMAEKAAKAKMSAQKQPAVKTARTLAANRPGEIKEVYTGIYVASKNSKVFHRSTCSSAKRMTDKTRLTFSGRPQAEQSGRRPCKICKP